MSKDLKGNSLAHLLHLPLSNSLIKSNESILTYAAKVVQQEITIPKSKIKNLVLDRQQPLPLIASLKTFKTDLLATNNPELSTVNSL